MGKKAFKIKRQDLIEAQVELMSAIKELIRKLGEASNEKTRKAVEALVLIELYSSLTDRKHPRLNMVTCCDVDYCINYIREVGLDIITMSED